MENLNKIEIGRIYSYTNSKGYTTSIIVTKYNNKSVWATWTNGKYEHRISLNTFNKYYK